MKVLEDLVAWLRGPEPSAEELEHLVFEAEVGLALVYMSFPDPLYGPYISAHSRWMQWWVALNLGVMFWWVSLRGQEVPVTITGRRDGRPISLEDTHRLGGTYTERF